MPRALLLENIDPVAVELLESAGYDVEARRGALDEDDLIEALDGVALLGIRSKTQVTAEVVRACPELLAVGAFCIGTNQIDLRAAAQAGVAVFNAPFSNTRSVVEMALAEIIILARRLVDRDRALHSGTWDKSAAGSHEIRGRTLGIVGYGNIGSQLSVLAEALGMSVLFYDSADKLALGNARRCGSLDELLAESDVVTLHVDGRVSNSSLFGEEQFSRMRAGSIFLNLSRGFVVDHGAAGPDGDGVSVFTVADDGDLLDLVRWRAGDEARSAEVRGREALLLLHHGPAPGQPALLRHRIRPSRREPGPTHPRRRFGRRRRPQRRRQHGHPLLRRRPRRGGRRAGGGGLRRRRRRPGAGRGPG